MTTYKWDADLTPLFEGRAIVATDFQAETLTLDDGTVLRVVPNEGCGGCPNGEFVLTHLNKCENIITKAEVVVEDVPGESQERYSLFVFAGADKLNVAEVAGSEGNGYYGEGFRLHVTRDLRGRE